MKTNERLREIRQRADGQYKYIVTDHDYCFDVPFLLARLDELVKLAREHLNDFDNEFGSREKLERYLAELEKGE